jgi:hypothetical protein
MLQWIFLLFLNHQWMAYAFSFEGWKKHKKLKIAGEVAAGSNETFTLDSWKCSSHFHRCCSS